LEARAQPFNPQGQTLHPLEIRQLLQAKLKEMALFYATELRRSFEQIRQNRTRIHQELLLIIETEELRRGQGRVTSRDEFEVLKELEAMNNELDQPVRFRDVIPRLDQESERETSRRDFLLPFALTLSQQ
jgi:hypothetical protein